MKNILKLAILAATAVLILGRTMVKDPNQEWFTPPPTARPCSRVITEAVLYCAPFVAEDYKKIYAKDGRKAAYCRSRITSYRCTAEAICSECSAEESVEFEAKLRANLRSYQNAPMCKPFQYLMMTDGSYCDYLQYKDRGAETTTTETSPLANENSTISANSSSTNATSVSSTQTDDGSKKNLAPTLWPIEVSVFLSLLLPLVIWFAVQYLRNKWYPASSISKMDQLSRKV